MKILENKFGNGTNQTIAKTKKEITIECEHCDSVFVMDCDELDEECSIGAYGIKRVKCPCCGEMTDTDEDIKLNAYNITFPTHFHHAENTARISNDEIQNWIEKGLEWFENNPNEDYWYTASGNTTVIIFNLEDEFEIKVFKDEYNSFIEKEEN